MKIVIISNFDRKGGGAHIAAARLAQALIGHGHQVKMLVKVKSTDDQYVHSATTGFFTKVESVFKEYFERIRLIVSIREKLEWYNFSTGKWGISIDKHPLIQEADVVHLHWINKSFISIKELQKISQAGKKIVWTMHDMWPFTGGCHYAKECTNYQQKCGNCPILKYSHQHDLSRQIWKYKKDILEQLNISGVTCSSWLMNSARSSSLFSNKNVVTINNPIDTDFFSPSAEKELDYKLLFIARDIHDRRKGFDLLIKALDIIGSRKTELLEKITLVLGGAGEFNKSDAIYKIEAKGYIQSADQIRELYTSSDLFLLPSREDNLPNTLVEASACGLPSIAFSVGGIPEMIENGRTGFLVEAENSDLLASRIIEYFSNSEETRISFGRNARQLALRKYSPQSVASSYLDVYKS